MLFKTYLRQNIVYVPTTAKRGTSVYTIIEPVVVVPVANTEDLRGAFRDVIARKNVTVPPPQGKWPQPVLLKYAGVKSWSAFARNASTWSIGENDGIYRIVGYRVHAKGYWVQDADQTVEFPSGTTVDVVIDRMIAILQEAARKE